MSNSKNSPKNNSMKGGKNLPRTEATSSSAASTPAPNKQQSSASERSDKTFYPQDSSTTTDGQTSQGYANFYDRQNKRQKNPRNKNGRSAVMRDTQVYQEIHRLAQSEKEGTMYLTFSYATLAKLIEYLPKNDEYITILEEALAETDKRKGKKSIDEQVLIREKFQPTHGLVLKNVPKDIIRQDLYQAILDLPQDKRFAANDFPGKCHLRSFPFPKAVAKDGTRNVFPIFVDPKDRDFLLDQASTDNGYFGLTVKVQSSGRERRIRLIVEKVHETKKETDNIGPRGPGMRGGAGDHPYHHPGMANGFHPNQAKPTYIGNLNYTFNGFRPDAPIFVPTGGFEGQAFRPQDQGVNQNDVVNDLNNRGARNNSGNTTPNSVMSFTSNISGNSTPIRPTGVNQTFGTYRAKLGAQNAQASEAKTNPNGQTGVSSDQNQLFSQLQGLSNFGSGLNINDATRMSQNSSPIAAITPISHVSGSPPTVEDQVQQLANQQRYLEMQEREMQINAMKIKSLSQENLNLIGQPQLNDPAILAQASLSQMGYNLSQPATPPPLASPIAMSPTPMSIQNNLISQNNELANGSDSSILPLHLNMNNAANANLLGMLTPPLASPIVTQAMNNQILNEAINSIMSGQAQGQNQVQDQAQTQVQNQVATSVAQTSQPGNLTPLIMPTQTQLAENSPVNPAIANLTRSSLSNAASPHGAIGEGPKSGTPSGDREKPAFAS